MCATAVVAETTHRFANSSHTGLFDFIEEKAILTTNSEGNTNASGVLQPAADHTTLIPTTVGYKANWIPNRTSPQRIFLSTYTVPTSAERPYEYYDLLHLDVVEIKILHIHIQGLQASTAVFYQKPRIHKHETIDVCLPNNYHINLRYRIV